MVANGIDEAHAVVLHEKADGVAVHAAAEAVIGLARGADREARRLLAVEGAQALVARAGPLQVDGTTDDLDDVDASEKVVDEAGRDHLRD